MIATSTPELLRIRKDTEERLKRKKSKETRPIRKKLFHKQTPDKESRHPENVERNEALRRERLSSKTDNPKLLKGKSRDLKTKGRKSGEPTGWKLPRRKQEQKKEGRPIMPPRKPIWMQHRPGRPTVQF